MDSRTTPDPRRDKFAYRKKRLRIVPDKSNDQQNTMSFRGGQGGSRGGSFGGSRGGSFGSGRGRGGFNSFNQGPPDQVVGERLQ